jgi:hypothetical protein
MSNVKEKLSNLTAAQRIEAIENMIVGLDTAVRQLANSLTTISQALKMLGSKVDAIVTASGSGSPITDEVLSRIMTENNALELKARLNELIQQGRLSSAEELTEQGFFVGREIDSETGEVVNPRIQMAVASLAKDVRDMLIGKKVGDVISFGEGKLSLELEEVYVINGFSSEEQKESSSN